MSQTPLVLQPLAQLQVAAASALVCAGDLLYLLADDELLLQRYDLNGVFIDQQPLLAGSLPSAAKARKRLKPDFEMLCQLPDGALLALGSGSTAARRRGVLWQAGVTRVLDLTALYLALENQLQDLNLEGAVVQGEHLWLAQRGNSAGSINALIRLDLATLMQQLAGDGLDAEVLRAVHAVELGTLHGVPLSFTDLCLDAQGRLLFAAAAEATKSSYHDGACLGSVVGCWHAGQVQSLWPLAGEAKIEGLCRVADGSLRLVNDPDSREARSWLYR
ncbi:MAG: hypothetical protein IV111_09205, partial [Pseudomonas sp.]|nr:hypothetical protein [Pseudomonas sp.]